MTRSLVSLALSFGLAVLQAAVALPAQDAHKDEHHHQPDAKQAAFWKQFSSRDEWQMPDRIMNDMGLKPGMTVADVGAGTGYFTLRLAERVGTKGRVYAEDIDAKALETLRSKAAKEPVRNIFIIEGSEEDPKLPEKNIDVVLMVNLLNNLEETKTLLSNTAKGLKPGGKLVIVQWDAEKIPSDGKDDLPFEKHFDPEWHASVGWTLRRLQEAGFEVVRILSYLPAQHFWVCKLRKGD